MTVTLVRYPLTKTRASSVPRNAARRFSSSFSNHAFGSLPTVVSAWGWPPVAGTRHKPSSVANTISRSPQLAPIVYAALPGTLQMLLAGPDLKRLTEANPNILKRLKAIPGAVDVDSTLITGKPELSVYVEYAIHNN